MPLPSVLLHDHLDGGVRPGTVLELAEELSYEALPRTAIGQLSSWFDQSESGSLERYLEAFHHTIAVMQTATALERVAYEAAVDLSTDGVVYAEIRFSPPLHTAGGLSPLEVIESVASGMRLGARETGLSWGLIIDALRQYPNSSELATLAAATRHLGVVGFDLAGPEAGYPPDDHLAAFRQARESGLRLTIHAGEAAGVDGVGYIASAIDRCGAERIGHGVELINDCIVEDGEIVKLGRVSERVRNRRVPLEMCPASNLATSRLDAVSHPIGAMYRAGFNVTLNTDNRLMSATSMSKEFEFVQQHHGFRLEDLALVTRRSLDAAFCDWDTKREVWESRLVPAYAEAGLAMEARWR